MSFMPGVSKMKSQMDQQELMKVLLLKMKQLFCL